MDFIGNGFKSTSFRYRPPRLGAFEWLPDLADLLKDIYTEEQKTKREEEKRKAAEAEARAIAAAAAAAAQAGAPAAGEIIPGVPNTVTLIGGLAIAGGIGYLAFKK